jgi:hypothetical protein
MFPGPNAQVYYNEAGEPLGWDYPSDEPYEPDDFEMSAADANAEAQYEQAYEAGEEDWALHGERRREGEFPTNEYGSAYEDGYRTAELNDEPEED